MKHHELQVDHLAFPSFDPEETWRFYTEVMRLPLIDVITTGGTEPLLITRFGLADGRQLMFFTIKDMERPADKVLPDWLCHYAFSASSVGALQDWRHRLSKLGIEFTEENNSNQRSLHFTDPNGVMLEVNYQPSDTLTGNSPNGALQEMRSWIRAHL